MVKGTQNRSEAIDPRVRRTRQMLHDSLERLLQSKTIDRISVGDIAEEATLNRATFYDHYPDKYELLQGLVAARFQDLFNKRGLVFNDSCPDALLRVITATCEYLASLPGADCPHRRQLQEHFDSAIIAVVRGTLLCGLQQHPRTDGISPELISATLSGAIYGGAREWIQTSDRVPVDQIVRAIFSLVHPIVMPV